MNGFAKSDVSLGELAADMEIRGESAQPPASSPLPSELVPGPHHDSSSSSIQILDFPAGTAEGAQPSWADLVATLRAAWDRRRANSFEFPITVWRIRQHLQGGQWSEFLASEDIPFARSQGYMLARTGKWLSRLNVQTFGRLPEGWSVLYVLTRLSPSPLQRHIVSKAVHPKMTLAQARRLAQGKTPLPRQTRVSRRLASFARFVKDTVGTWSSDERSQARLLLLELQTHLSRNTQTHPTSL